MVHAREAGYSGFARFSFFAIQWMEMAFMKGERKAVANRPLPRESRRLFDDAFKRYADELFRHATLRVSDREKAVDLVQDAFMRAFGGEGAGANIRDMRAFLYQTLRNLIIDEYRRKKASSLDALLENEDAHPDALLPTDETNTIEAAESRLDGAAALEKVRELPDPYAEVLILRYVDGLSPREIAERVDASENLVSVRIHRALGALRKLLTHTNP